MTPAVSARVATPSSTNGIAELSVPTTSSRPALPRSSPPLPCHSSTGSSVAAPIAQRTSISESGPNSGAATRMNRKEAPQIAARARNSAVSRADIG